MSWALRCPQEEHKIDRFHVKCAITTADGRIAVYARGRVAGMREQIKTLVLYFRPTLGANGWTVERDGYAEVFPTLMCRQLDHIQRSSNTLINVQDTPDDDNFEVTSINLEVKRRDGKHQLHKFHSVDQLVDKPGL